MNDTLVLRNVFQFCVMRLPQPIWGGGRAGTAGTLYTAVRTARRGRDKTATRGPDRPRCSENRSFVDVDAMISKIKMR